MSFIRDNFPGLTDSDTPAMIKRYPLMEKLPQHNTWFPSTSKAYGEATFICPTNLILDSFTKSSYASIWSYRYNVWDLSNTWRGVGVTHTFDSAAILGPGSLPTPESYYGYNAPIVPLLMNYYISFVRALDPNVYRHSSAPKWYSWWRDGERLVVELNKTRMETVGAGQKERCEFWKGLSGKMRH